MDNADFHARVFVQCEIIDASFNFRMHQQCEWKTPEQLPDAHVRLIEDLSVEHAGQRLIALQRHGGILPGIQLESDLAPHKKC
jgi:hypothetical protein